MIPSRYELYFDISGRVAEDTAGHEFLTVAGVCVLPETAPRLRQGCRSIPKWSDSTREDALACVHVLQGPVLTAMAIRMRKAQPAWSTFWNKAKEYYEAAAQRTRDNKGMAFSKAANVIKYFLFGECSARLAAETVKRVGKPTIRTSDDLARMQLVVVCDSDIQGADNISVFKHLWEEFGERQRLIKKAGLSIDTGDVELRTEQDEPILVLPDHVAGALQASGSSSVPAPRQMDSRDVDDIVDAYRRLDALTVIEREFDQAYESVFGGTQLWKLLWPED